MIKTIFLVISFLIIAPIEKLCEVLWYKNVKFTKIPIGFDRASKIEKIIQNNGPVTIPSSNKSSTEAIIFIHGATHSAKRMTKIHTSNKFQQWDCYFPLLMYHRRDLDSMHKINYHKMAQQLLQDIMYVTKKYDKVYCIGHSLGANLLCYLSLQKKLPDKVKLILYAPAIQVNIPQLGHIFCMHSTFPNKYILSPELFNKKTNLTKHIGEHIFSKQIINVLHKSTIVLKQMLASDQQISNDFVSIIILDDPRIPAKKVLKLLSKQKRSVGSIILNQLGHSPHLHKARYQIIAAELFKAIQLLQKS